MNSQVACEDTLIPTKYISENVEKLAEMVEVEISKEINNSFSKSEIMDCAEMFISLNSCPSYLEKLYLKVFYESETTGKIALFTSNIVKQLLLHFYFQKKFSNTIFREMTDKN